MSWVLGSSSVNLPARPAFQQCQHSVAPLNPVPVLVVVHAVVDAKVVVAVGSVAAASWSAVHFALRGCAFEHVVDRPYDVFAGQESVVSLMKECANGHDPYDCTSRLLCSPRKESASDRTRVNDKDAA